MVSNALAGSEVLQVLSSFLGPAAVSRRMPRPDSAGAAGAIFLGVVRVQRSVEDLLLGQLELHLQPRPNGAPNPEHWRAGRERRIASRAERRPGGPSGGGGRLGQGLNGPQISIELYVPHLVQRIRNHGLGLPPRAAGSYYSVRRYNPQNDRSLRARAEHPKRYLMLARCLL